MTAPILLEDRDIKRFKLRTDDGHVELNLSFAGMLERYTVWGFMNGAWIEAKGFDNAFDAFHHYNTLFVDVKAEAAALLVKATGAHV